MRQPQRILICGVGSIGERHIRNLLSIGQQDIAVLRSKTTPFRTLDRSFPVFSDLSETLRSFRPTVVFVTNPTSLHARTSLVAAEAGCHLLIEKPVSHRLEDIAPIEAALARTGCFAMVAYMLRFHPLFRRVKAWLDEGPEGTLGRPLFARSSWGEHVPDWHPWEDYATTYAVQENAGGGAALTLSHDIDLMVWMFGKATSVKGMSMRHASLDGDADHVTDLLLRFGSGVTANVHLDLCQRPPHRSWELVCSRGKVVIDYPTGVLRRWDGLVGERPPASGARPPTEHVERVPQGFDRNDLFIAELHYFFDCLDRNIPPSPGLQEAGESVRIAQHALEEST